MRRQGGSHKNHLDHTLSNCISREMGLYASMDIRWYYRDIYDSSALSALYQSMKVSGTIIFSLLEAG